MAAALQGLQVCQGQNNGDCIEGPLTLGFYLAPGMQCRVWSPREDMHVCACVCEVFTCS